jgi:hypothetical protein
MTIEKEKDELDKLAEKTFKGDDATTFVQREIWKDGYRKAKETLYPVENVTRFEVIDHTKEMLGRAYVKYGVQVELSFQDDGKTLKVFVDDKI